MPETELKMKKKYFITLGYIAAALGTGLSIFAYENSSVLSGRSECIVHIAMWSIVILVMLIEDVSIREYRIESMFLMGLCTVLNLISWGEKNFPYYLGKLTVSAIVVALLAAGIYFVAQHSFSGKYQCST